MSDERWKDLGGSRRDFLKKVVAAGFAAPVVVTFALDGIAEAVPQSLANQPPPQYFANQPPPQYFANQPPPPPMQHCGNQPPPFQHISNQTLTEVD